MSMRCSSATGLCASWRHSTGSRSRNSAVVSSSQLHQRFWASAHSRWCDGATNSPSVRASLTTGASCWPAASSLPHGVGAEGARGQRLHDEHALQQPAIDQRHAEKRLVRILACLAEVLEARMRRRVLDHLRLHLLADQADQALGQPHPDLADALGPQPDRRRQDQRGAIRFEQIHRADVGAEALLDQPDEVRQGLGGVAALGHQAGDLVAGPERGVICGRGAVGHGVVTE